MTQITVKAENAQKAYNVADDKTKEVLIALFGDCLKPQDTRPIEERVKTYEDACMALGVEPQTYEDMPYDVAAYLKLRTIVEALNEGWLPQFTEDEYRYYPWFYLYTQEEIDDMDEDSKKDLVRFGGNAYAGSLAGFACSCSSFAPWLTVAGLGSRLCFKTRELALYCGKQFVDIWADFCLVRK